MPTPHSIPIDASGTVVHLLAHAARLSPDAQALACGATRMSYAAYAAHVAEFAEELDALGAAGQRVATLLPNSAAACVVTFAVFASGAQLAPLNPLYTQRELAQILDDAEPGILIADLQFKTIAQAVAGAAGIRHLILLDAHTRFSSTSTQIGATALQLPDPDSPALLQYTGGTTGVPKGVSLTHRAIATNVAQREALLPTKQAAERILCVMPLFHSYAMSMGLFLAANCHGSLIVHPRYRPDDVLSAIASEKITIFPGSPTIFTGLLSHAGFSNTDWSTLHTCYSGSAPLAEDIMLRWQTAVGAPVLEGYGQTEAGPILTYNPARGPIKPGSVGIPVPLTEVQIVDLDTGSTPLSNGARGEVRARGPQIMSEYRNRPAETAEALRDGWLYTGDIGEFDNDGYLYIRDRKKDLVIVGGYNVYPREVDEVLFTHPAVADAAAIGVKDSYRGEVIRAYVTLRQGFLVDAAELIEYCKKNLAIYKVPVRIDLLPEIPKTSVNKTDKKALRELARRS